MTDRLISADALYKRYQDMCMGVACNACPFLDLQNGCKIENLIDSAPTVEAEPIVRCRDCKWYRENEAYCWEWVTWSNPDDFCSRGERKDEVEE